MFIVNSYVRCYYSFVIFASSTTVLQSSNKEGCINATALFINKTKSLLMEINLKLNFYFIKDLNLISFNKIDLLIIFKFRNLKIK